jgi:hypothetical protein
MNTVDDLVFRVKGKKVSAPMTEIKALPEAERHKAYMRLRTLGSAVAGFTGMATKMPPTMAMGGAGAAPRARSPSPKPKKAAPRQSPGSAMEDHIEDILKAFVEKDSLDGEDYGELIDEYGQDDMVEEVVKRMKKDRYTVKQIVKGMKDLREEGYTMFADYIEEHS